MGFNLNSRLTLARTTVGREHEPILKVEDLLAEPDGLVAEAAAAVFSPAWGPAGGYPGVRAPAPLDYVEIVARALLPVIVDAFSLPPAGLRRAECNFSLATLPPGRLRASQRAPHVDTVDPWQFAILHYLCDHRFGGTAFYRHRATSFEALTPEREAEYRTARQAETAASGYIVGDDPWFERIGGVDAAFNRLVIYRSRLLHSGTIVAPKLLTDDPLTGRLTANIFLTLGPKN